MKAALLAMAAVALGGCGSNAAEPTPQVVKVAVLRDGAILVDGVPSDGEQLKRRLSEAGQRARVLYYRDDSDRDPSSSAERSMTLVLETAMSARVPISLSSKPDFSDMVDGQGVSHPRKAR